MKPRPPTSTLFPTRRSSDLTCSACVRLDSAWAVVDMRSARAELATIDLDLLRSEEHTSELQSLRQLVCRLMLEKKKICRVILRCWTFNIVCLRKSEI